MQVSSSTARTLSRSVGTSSPAEGDGETNVRSQMPVGTLALHTGLWPSIEEYGEFIRIVNKDHSGASAAIQKAFS